jgi:uncharacterized membrane protein
MRDKPRWVARIALALLFGAAGVGHFTHTAQFAAIVPPWLPWPDGLVWISGVCELLGALGLLIRRVRPAARWGLLALLVAVFPANIYMAMEQVTIPGMAPAPAWALWARLPLQAVLMMLVWWAGAPGARPKLELPR